MQRNLKKRVLGERTEKGEGREEMVTKEKGQRREENIPQVIYAPSSSMC